MILINAWSILGMFFWIAVGCGILVAIVYGLSWMAEDSLNFWYVVAVGFICLLVYIFKLGV